MKKVRAGIGYLALGFLVIGVVYGVLRQTLPWLMPATAFSYSLKYTNVARDHISIDPQPHGCAFDDAPLGDKHCHWKPSLILTGSCTTLSCPSYMPSLPLADDNQPIADDAVTRVGVIWLKISE